MSFIFRAAATTDVGTVRTNNEDAAIASPQLIAVADGMGGHAAGEVASGVVIDQLAQLVKRADDGAARLGDHTVTSALQRSRDALRAMSAVDVELAGMGTTLVGLVATGAELLLVHIGDSRLYRLRDGELTQVTVDHTHVQHLVDSGRLSPELVRSHPFRSVILRSLDDTSDDLPDVGSTSELVAGDRILLCSDGLSDYVEEELIRHGLAVGSPQEAADRLVAVAIAQSTRDNVTALVADVVAAEDGEGGLPVTQLGVAPAEMVLTRSAREAMETALAIADEGPDAEVPAVEVLAAEVLAAPAIADDGFERDDADADPSEADSALTGLIAPEHEESHDPIDLPEFSPAQRQGSSDRGTLEAHSHRAATALDILAEPTAAPELDAVPGENGAVGASSSGEGSAGDGEGRAGDGAGRAGDGAADPSPHPDGDPDTAASPVVVDPLEPDDGDADAAEPAEMAAATTSGGAASKPTGREVLWMSLVVVTFLAVAAWVWFAA